VERTRPSFSPNFIDAQKALRVPIYKAQVHCPSVSQFLGDFVELKPSVLPRLLCFCNPYQYPYTNILLPRQRCATLRK
jgi:hypothetical protein